MIKAWSTVVNSVNVVDIWQGKLRAFRRLARGWSANIDAEIRKHKKKSDGNL